MVFAYLRLMRLDRPIGALLLLWPTAWALWLAGDGRPLLPTVAVFIAGVFVMRAAGCVINDIADRRIDPQVKRTRGRPLASGELSARQAWTVFALLIIAAVALALQLQFRTQLFAATGALIACAYPLAKRVTHLPQLALGVAFSWGIPMAYIEITGALPAEAFLLFAANFAWVIAYDTQYAMVDRDDDLRIGVGSTAILFGRHDNRIVGALHIICVALLAAVGWQRALAWHFYLGLAAALAFAAYQQWLCRARDRAQCLRAFINNNWFGAAVFAGMVLALSG